MCSNLFDVEIRIFIDLVHHLDIQPILKKLHAQFMSVVKICQKGNDVFSHSVTLFKCGGTGSTGTSQHLSPIGKTKKKSVNFVKLSITLAPKTKNSFISESCD